jgi:uncharacterized protein YggE
LGLVPALALAGLVGWAGRSAASASTGIAQPSPDAPPRSILVVGTGKVTVKPDMATIQVGVETRGESAVTASSDNTDRINAILDALKGAGVAEKDIQTTNFSIYVDQPRGPSGELVGKTQYVVSNNVHVTVRDLATVGRVLEAAVSAGANQVYGISFGVADTSKLQIAAEESALDDARTRAEALAAKAGVQIGEILSISESVGSQPPIVFDAYRKGMEMAAGAPVPVQPGEMEIHAQVQVVYALR